MSEATVETTKTIDTDLFDAALEEVLRRYPDAQGAFAWFITAIGFRSIEPTEEHLKWAKEIMDKRADP